VKKNKSVINFWMLVAVACFLMIGFAGCGEKKEETKRPVAKKIPFKATTGAKDSGSSDFSSYGADFSNVPKTNNGKKWRIGYLEGGPYQNYPMTLKAIVNGFISLGWMEPIQFPLQEDQDDTGQLWLWLSENAKSKYINFVKDAHWSANWDDNLREKVKKDILTRLVTKKDIDLMIAMGTWAGQDLANNEHNVPTVVCSSTDPIKAGIVKSLNDSGYDHVHARLDPTIHKRQIRLFHDIIGFKKLGIAYENSISGRSIAAVEDIEEVAKERGFEIIRCNIIDDNPDMKISERSVVKCYNELAPQADAIYITISNGVKPSNMPNMLAPLNKYKIPTFSQGGSLEVKYGALLSIAKAEFLYVGKFHAKIIAKIFNGAKPRNLEQVFEDPSKIAINLATAQIIGYDPPVDILGAADEIYQKIETAK